MLMYCITMFVIENTMMQCQNTIIIVLYKNNIPKPIHPIRSLPKMKPVYIIYKRPGAMLPPDDHIHQAITCNMRSAGLTQDHPGEHSPRPFPSSQPPPLKKEEKPLIIYTTKARNTSSHTLAED